MVLLIFLFFLISCTVKGQGNDDYGEEMWKPAVLQQIAYDIRKVLQILNEEKSHEKCIEHEGPLKNLAYGRKTYQSSIHGPAVSDRAVDGIRNSHYWKGGSCAHTGAESHPYWYVDLGKERIIESIRITNRGDCCPWRLHDVDVTVAGHNKRFDSVCGTFRGPGKASEIVVVQCPKGTEGRYVRLQITKGSNNYLTVCEVEVMGR